MTGAEAGARDQRTTAVLVVGDVINDVIVRPTGPSAIDTDVEAQVAAIGGGSGANLAAWLAALGVTVRLVARVGRLDGADHRRDLSAAGVDARLTIDPTLPTGTIVVMVGAGGNRTMFTDRGANAALGDGADLGVDILDGVDHLHVSGRTFASPAARRALADRWQDAGRRGLTRSVDVGSAAFMREVGPAFLDWSAGADVVFANLAEGRIIAGLDEHADRDDVSARLVSHYRVVVLTSGPQGAVVADRSETVVCPPAGARVVDPTGAGDAFCAGFLAAWLRGAGLPAAAAAATATAAQSLSLVGGRPPPAPSTGLGPNPPWEALRRRAHAVSSHAHAPYSGLRVGAAGITDDGRIVAACNVENASFGLTLCAECGLVSALRSAGADRLVAVAVVAQDGKPLAPCGRCRQVLFDNGGPGLLIDRGPGNEAVRLGDLLPEPFGGDDIAGRNQQ